MNIHDIADQLVRSGAVSSNDFELINSEIVPKDDYTKEFIKSEINALGYEVVEQGNNLLLTGETIAEPELSEDLNESNNPISVALGTIQDLKTAETKEKAEAIMQRFKSMLPLAGGKLQKGAQYLLGDPEYLTVLKVVDNTLDTRFINQLQAAAEGSSLEEVKDVISEPEVKRTQSEVRRLLEALVNQTEDAIFTMEEQDAQVNTSQYVSQLKIVLQQLTNIRNQANGITKGKPSVDF